jgi:hypothetical protein
MLPPLRKLLSYGLPSLGSGLEPLSLSSLLSLYLRGLLSFPSRYPSRFSRLGRFSRLVSFRGFRGSYSRGTLGTLIKELIGFPDRDEACHALKPSLRHFAIATSHAPCIAIVGIGELPSIGVTPLAQGF